MVGNREDSKSFSVITKGPADTQAFGACVGSVLFPGAVVGLVGELGAGKTCFVKGVAYGVNATPDHEVTSPTFALLHEYVGSPSVYHFDAYRIDTCSEFTALGFDEYLEAGGIVVVEWADQVIEAFPEQRLMVSFEIRTGNERCITCVAYGAAYDALLEKLRSYDTMVGQTV